MATTYNCRQYLIDNPPVPPEDPAFYPDCQTATPTPTLTPTPTPPPPLVVCPTDTSSCSSNYTVTIAGGTGWCSQSGGTGELYPWDAINGTWNLTKSGNSWRATGWNGTAHSSHGGHTPADIQLACDSLNFSPPRWRLQAFVDDGIGTNMTWTRSVGITCPPDGVWDYYSCYGWCPSGCTPPTVSAT